MRKYTYQLPITKNNYIIEAKSKLEADKKYAKYIESVINKDTESIVDYLLEGLERFKYIEKHYQIDLLRNLRYRELAAKVLIKKALGKDICVSVNGSGEDATGYLLKDQIGNKIEIKSVYVNRKSNLFKRAKFFFDKQESRDKRESTINISSLVLCVYNKKYNTYPFYTFIPNFGGDKHKIWRDTISKKQDIIMKGLM